MLLSEEQLREEGLSEKAIAKLKSKGSRVVKNDTGEYAIKGYIDIVCTDVKTLEKILSY